MKRTDAGFAPIILIVIVAVGLVGWGGYWFATHDKVSRGQLLSDLAAAQARVDAETDKLRQLQDQFKSSHPINTALQAENDRVQTQVRAKIDVLFSKFESRPVIAVPTGSADTQFDINLARLEIDQILKQWQQRIQTDFYSDMDISTIQSMKNDMGKVKSFITQLQDVMKSVTPANSGLTVTEIKSYSAGLIDAIKEIDSVVSSLNTAQSIAQAAQDAAVADTSSGTASTDTHTSTQVAVVTPEQIQKQQQAVAQAQEEVVEIKVVLAATPEDEEEDDDNGDSTNTGTSNTSTNTSQSSGGTQTTSDTTTVSTTTSQTATKTLTPKTGKPKLIQGSNTD